MSVVSPTSQFAYSLRSWWYGAREIKFWRRDGIVGGREIKFWRRSREKYQIPSPHSPRGSAARLSDPPPLAAVKTSFRVRLHPATQVNSPTSRSCSLTRSEWIRLHWSRFAYTSKYFLKMDEYHCLQLAEESYLTVFPVKFRDITAFDWGGERLLVRVIGRFEKWGLISSLCPVRRLLTIIIIILVKGRSRGKSRNNSSM